MDQFSSPRQGEAALGVLIVGLGGAVATTAVAGIELLRQGIIGKEGLPLSQAPQELVAGLAPYENIRFGGWDLSGDDLAMAAAGHRVLTSEQAAASRNFLSQITPWPAVGNAVFLKNVGGENQVVAGGHRASVDAIAQRIRTFRTENGIEEVVMINLASTEKMVDRQADIFQTPEAFEAALDEGDAQISPGVLYAYAAIQEGVPYGNFTPSVAADLPALVQMAERHGVPLAGKDGKTGQTMIKTVIAPALRTRALKVEGWFSTNILGNRDGLALSDADSLKSKVATKSSVLDQILGYTVENHLVDIRYYKPRGDNKEAWDNIDVTGFLGQPMQIKINFLCKDSILAAPLVIEIARLLQLCKQRGERGVQGQLSVFFKLPQVPREGDQPIHALHEQETMLFDWLRTGSEAKPTAAGEGHKADPAPASGRTPAATYQPPVLAELETESADRGSRH